MRHFLAALGLAFLFGDGALSPALAFDARLADRSVVRVIVVVEREGRALAAGSGTGFVVAPGHVATNHHVVHHDETLAQHPESKGTVKIRIAGEKKEFAASVIWKSAEVDLAILKVDGLDRAPLQLSSASPDAYPAKGDRVWAIGYPGLADRVMAAEHDLASSTVTQGVVGRIGGGRADPQERVRPIIQHDAAIHPGNSGGPLFDNCGVVLGVNTFLPTSVLEIGRDAGGAYRAHGTPNTGVFASPHIASLLQAAVMAPELGSLRWTTTGEACPTASGIPVWAITALALVGLLGATGIGLTLTRRREVVRVVESYSAWRHRRGGRPGAGGPIEERTAPPVAFAAGKPSLGDWRLRGTAPDGAAVTLPVPGERLAAAAATGEKGLVIGRSPRLADLVLAQPGISRRHARLRAATAGLVLEDLDAAYGTRVNGAPLAAFQPAKLAAGDRISLGGFELTLEAASAGTDKDGAGARKE